MFLSTSQLLQEIRAAESIRDAHTTLVRQMLRKLTGSYNRSRVDEIEEHQSENAFFEVLSVVLPRLIHDNPRVRVTTRRGGPAARVAKAMHIALNRWSVDVRLERILERVVTDMLFGWGIIKIGQAENANLRGVRIPDWQAIPHYPHPERISPFDFFCDHGAKDRDQCRFMGHPIVEQYDELLARARLHKEDQGWNVEAVEALAPRSNFQEGRFGPGGELPYRKEVRYYEVYIPGGDLSEDDAAFWEEPEDFIPEDDGFHGIIRTVAVEGDLREGTDSETPRQDNRIQFDPMEDSGGTDGEPVARELRRARRFYGPRTGPYVTFGVYEVPDEVYPLAPMQALQSIIEEMDAVERAVSRQIASYKRFVAADSEIGDRLQSAKNDHVVNIPGFDASKAQQYEVGGPSEAMIASRAYLRDVFERMAGIADVGLGQSQANRTATADSLADTASQVRFSLLQKSAVRGVTDLFWAAGWYVFYDDRVILPLGPEAAGLLELELGENEEAWYVGGHSKEAGYTYDDLEARLQPYTMERVDQATLARTLMQGATLVLDVAPMVPQMPWVQWKTWLERVGDALNMPDLSELLNVDVAMQFAGQGPQAGGPVAQPRMAGNAGGTWSRGRLRTPGAPGGSQATAPGQGRQPASSIGVALRGQESGGRLAASSRGAPAS